jgi:hypothetical protein
MNRTLIAAALAAVILPAGAFDAAAAPGVATTFGKTYTLQCDVNVMDGTALKTRILVKNTTGRAIEQGTPITLRYSYGFGPGGYGQKRIYTQTQVAYRQVPAGQGIGLDQPQGARRCTATVTLRPNVQALKTPIKVTR